MRNMAEPPKATRRSDRDTKRVDSVTAAFLKLRDLIVQGEIAPGSWVVEAELVERLSFSRTPIRGALQLLQREGFIVEHRTGGKKKPRLRISPLTKEDARELYRIVGTIEGLAGGLTAALPDEKRRQLCVKLKEINQRMHDIAASKNVELRSVFDLDTRFHHEIIAASAGPRVLTIHHMMKPQIERYWRLYAHTIIQDLHLSVSEHEQIIAGISKGNARATERGLANNWRKGAERIYSLIDLFGERGSW
jgi:DNA-binding GntR family transcriptional regulator